MSSDQREAAPKQAPPPRQLLLEEAIDLVCRDRGPQYGPPTRNFEDTAVMFTQVLRPLLAEGAEVRPYHVAMLMVCLKLARMTYSPANRDHWADIAGYAACGWECMDLEAEG